MTEFKVLYLGGADGYAATAQTLSKMAEVIHVESTGEALQEQITSAHGILDASMKVRITDEMVDSAQELRVISCATTGSDHIEREVLDQRKIPVLTLKEDRKILNNITPAAELSWALLMACARNLVGAVSHVQSGEWVRENFPGTMLNGRTLGLIGCGRIGGWMSRYAQAFGMTVKGIDPYLTEYPQGVVPVSMEELFETCDFVSIHVHLTEETQGLVSADLIARSKPGLVMINTSRGAIVDEVALLDALECGRIAGAGLDVLIGEPDIENHPLVRYAQTHDNLLITPHCGGYSPDALQFVCSHAAGKIQRILNEETFPC